MFFESSTPSIVRSVRQRDLLNTWLRLRAHFGGLATIAEYRPARLEDELEAASSEIERLRAAKGREA